MGVQSGERRAKSRRSQQPADMLYQVCVFCDGNDPECKVCVPLRVVPVGVTCRQLEAMHRKLHPEAYAEPSCRWWVEPDLCSHCAGG